MKWLLRIIIAILILFLALFVGKYLHHHIKRNSVEALWQNRTKQRVLNFGSTKTLSVLPLVNWHKSRNDLRGEMGVSYLIKTDTNTILFDLGHNAKEEDPSPLIHNMQKLGISLADVDTIFISHLHFDHIGGKKWEKKNTFSTGNTQIELKVKQVFSPVSMTYPGLHPITTSEPTALLSGVASMGTILRQLFMGQIEEQALVVNVAGKGIVIFSGCGHQTLPKILKKAEETFQERIYGVIGDLHYPVPTGRLKLLGINAQRFFASGDGPFQTIDEKEIERDITLVRNLNPGIVAVGGHDSSDEVIARFADVFGSVYRHVRMGEWIRIQ